MVCPMRVWAAYQAFPTWRGLTDGSRCVHREQLVDVVVSAGGLEVCRQLDHPVAFDGVRQAAGGQLRQAAGEAAPVVQDRAGEFPVQETQALFAQTSACVRVLQAMHAHRTGSSVVPQQRPAGQLEHQAHALVLQAQLIPQPVGGLGRYCAAPFEDGQRQVARAVRVLQVPDADVQYPEQVLVLVVVRQPDQQLVKIGIPYRVTQVRPGVVMRGHRSGDGEGQRQAFALVRYLLGLRRQVGGALPCPGDEQSPGELGWEDVDWDRTDRPRLAEDRAVTRSDQES
jgi:hypothetical protein